MQDIQKNLKSAFSSVAFAVAAPVIGLSGVFYAAYKLEEHQAREYLLDHHQLRMTKYLAIFVYGDKDAQCDKPERSMRGGQSLFTALTAEGEEVKGAFCRKPIWAKDNTPYIRIAPKNP